MTTEEKTESYLPGVFVAIVLIVPTMLILAIVAWGIYSPIPFMAEFNKLTYVNTTALVPDTQITYSISEDYPSGFFSKVLAISDSNRHEYYSVRVVEGPDFGSMLPIPPKEVVNQSGGSESIVLHHHLNPCTFTRLVITTEASYFIKDFPQTAVCG
jgi:hypothetical protein